MRSKTLYYYSIFYTKDDTTYIAAIIAHNAKEAKETLLKDTGALKIGFVQRTCPV